MTFCASIPVTMATSANTTLQLAGFGPNNFSVTTRVAPNNGPATHMSLSHGGTDAAFQAALVALSGCLIDSQPFASHIATRTLTWIKPEIALPRQ